MKQREAFSASHLSKKSETQHAVKNGVLFYNMKIIDFHTHILPGADHGSDSVETSLKQIELSKSANIDVFIATPHFYPHKHKLEKFLERRDSAYNALIARTNAKIIRGAEVLLCEKIENLNNLGALCIEDTKTLLIELPFSQFKESYLYSIDALIESGYNVVIAHADRYPKENIEQLLRLGVKIQLNVSSIAKLFVKKHIKKWIESDYVVALGSDIHMLNTDSYKNFNKAKLKLKDKFSKIMEETEKYIYRSEKL